MSDLLVPLAVSLAGIALMWRLIAWQRRRRAARRVAARRWAQALGLHSRAEGGAAFVEGTIDGASVHIELGHQQGRLEAWIRVAAQPGASPPEPDREELRRMLLERGSYAVQPGEYVTGLAADIPANELPARFARMAWFAVESAGLSPAQLDQLNPRTPEADRSD